MSVLAHWIPTLAAAFILAIAGFILYARERVERRPMIGRRKTTEPRV